MEISTWQHYVGTLPAHIQQHAEALRQSVVRICRDSHLDGCTFLPDQTNHVEYEDAAQVFSEAFAQTLLRKPLTQHEIPLLYLGYHLATRFTGTRYVHGFLLSDQAVYLQDDFSVIGEAPLPQAFALPRNPQDVAAFIGQLGQRFKGWKDWAKLEDADVDTWQREVLVLLQSAITTILAYHQQHGSQQTLQPQTIDLAKFVAAHGLGETIRAGNLPENAKKLDKVSAKFRIPAGEAIHLAIADFPFLGGPYGIALTASAVYTKDLMEDPLRLPLSEVDERTLRYSDDGKEMRINGDTPLFFPNHIKSAVRDEVLELLSQKIRLLKG